ncbi:AraC family transcriptional regulator [Flavobacterium terrisoli]|uniref:AraC family transcriptional regulator n=1 Tax=Flavobacterium terrisoli TaxID=3242195 RepID=UPI0025435F15|nr:AraC family transcriptional regulator [Flavobacterium buctense]
MIQKRNLLSVVLLISYCAVAQLPIRSSDTLTSKDFEYLSNGFSSNLNNPFKSKIYAQAWLQKAKTEKENYSQLALAYKALILSAEKKFRLLYADSMVAAAKQTKDIELIGSAYMTKGIVQYDCKEQIKALDNYLIADKYISQTTNQYLIYKIKYGIAQVKYYLGFYDEAISLFRECIDYFKEENDRAYLNSIHCLGLCYNRIGNYEWCTLTNQMGIDEGKKLEDTGMEFYFDHSEGVNQCGKRNYTVAIQKLTSALPGVTNLKDFANESVAYFYIGKSYWELKQQQKAVSYLKKVDAIFEKEKYIRPDLRESYEILIDYYKNKGDTKSQLYYINQLLRVDHVLGQNYKYLLRKIVKEYDTKELLKSKQEIENAMTFRTIIGFGIITLMALIILYLAYRHFKNKRLFEEVMKRDTTQPRILDETNEKIVLDVATNQKAIEQIIPESNNKQTTQEISPDIEAGILKRLEKLELNKKYLEKDMTLVKMASLLNTNTKYVTKVIAKHRGKGTIDYITDLKTDYIIEILKKESKYRNYTNKALGEEAGFGSTQNFTRAFKVRTGITPTYFIYKLKKSIAADYSQ